MKPFALLKNYRCIKCEQLAHGFNGISLDMCLPHNNIENMNK